MKKPTEEERKELYLQAINIVLFNLTETNYLCNVLGGLFYEDEYTTINGKKFINEETFPELLLFREPDREYSAWLSLFRYWDLSYSDYWQSDKEREQIVNEGKINILLLCIEMID